MLSKKVRLLAQKHRQVVGVFLWLVLAMVVVVLRIGHAQQSSPQQPAAAAAPPALITGKSTTSPPTGVTLGRRTKKGVGTDQAWQVHAPRASKAEQGRDAYVCELVIAR